MCAEASTVLRAVAADFFFNCWYLEVLSNNLFGTYQGASTIVRKAFDWKHSRISMLEVDAVPQSCIPQVQIGLSIDRFIYEKFVVCREF
jgi:hypothetical protein